MRSFPAILQAVILASLPVINSEYIEERQFDQGYQQCNYVLRSDPPTKAHCGVQGDVPHPKPLETFSTPSLEICRNSCLTDPKCISFQFSPDPGTCTRYPHTLRGGKYKISANGKYGYHRACFTMRCTPLEDPSTQDCSCTQQQKRAFSSNENELSERDTCNPCQFERRLNDRSPTLMWKRQECGCQQQLKRSFDWLWRRQEQCGQFKERSLPHLLPRQQCCQQQQLHRTRDLLQTRQSSSFKPTALVAAGTVSSLDGKGLKTLADVSSDTSRAVFDDPSIYQQFWEPEYSEASDWSLSDTYPTYAATYDDQSYSEATGQPVIFRSTSSDLSETPKLRCGVNANTNRGIMGCNTGDPSAQVVFYTCNPEEGELLFGPSVPPHCLQVTLLNHYGCQQQR